MPNLVCFTPLANSRLVPGDVLPKVVNLGVDRLATALGVEFRGVCGDRPDDQPEIRGYLGVRALLSMLAGPVTKLTPKSTLFTRWLAALRVTAIGKIK